MAEPAGSDPAQITALLRRAQAGDAAAEADLLARVYADLHRIARGQIGRERSSHTLQATALVHEAYLRIFGRELPPFRDRGHFLAAASRAMRHVLVDHARLRGALRRGGQQGRDPLDETLAGFEARGVDVVAVHDALEALGRQDPELVQIVEMHFFAGLTLREVGAALGLAERTVYARWSLARAWLRGKLA
jgi:RNA polymerase sigma factor (TIGR02999 family)